jgi:hypothetical protein
MTAKPILPKVYLGDSHDAEFLPPAVDAILNVAFDLRNHHQWNRVHLAQCGLIDGPGNSLAAYYSAVLQLGALLQLGKTVLVHCHKGESRSVAVIIFYLHAVNGEGWDANLARIQEAIAPRVIPLTAPNPAHRLAFDLLDFKALFHGFSVVPA